MNKPAFGLCFLILVSVVLAEWPTKDSLGELRLKWLMARRRALAPIDAVRAWLDGDFGIGDEPALIAAIRRDARVTGSDDDITDTICDAMDEGLEASACLARLVGSR